MVGSLHHPEVAMLLLSAGLLACATARSPPIVHPAGPSCPQPVLPSGPDERVERTEMPAALYAIERALLDAIDFQDPWARVELEVTVSAVVASVDWNVGEGYAHCTMVYDREGLASRSCEGEYVSHSMGDSNKRYVYTTQERFAERRVAASGNLRTTLLLTGAGEDTAITLANAEEVIDRYFNAPTRVPSGLVGEALSVE